MTFDEARAVLRALPGVAEGSSYGTPGFKVGKKLLTRFHQDGRSLVIFVGSLDERDMMLEAQPELFHITDHYRDYPMLLAACAGLTPATLVRLVEPRLREIAPRPRKAASPNPRTRKRPKA